MKLAGSRQPQGLTLVEVIVVLAVIVILFGLMVPASGSRPKVKARRIQCVNNLKNIGLAMRIFSTEHTNFPMVVPVSQGGARELTDDAGQLWQIYLRLTNELITPKILWCPSDERRRAAAAFNPSPRASETTPSFGNQHISYFLGPNATDDQPQTILAGDRNLTNETGVLGPGRHVLVTGSKLGFDDQIHQNAGNILLGDGSVQQLTSGRLRDQFRDALTNSGLATNVWLFP
jgi:prepilin-type N-terminal cleavage/methylation domain-containing protein/prepilin-type processing-associated H-X9-DG protein